MAHVEKPEEFQRVLYEPPPGRKPTAKVIAEEMAGFDSFAAAFGIKQPTRGTLPSTSGGDGG